MYNQVHHKKLLLDNLLLDTKLYNQVHYNVLLKQGWLSYKVV